MQEECTFTGMYVRHVRESVHTRAFASD